MKKLDSNLRIIFLVWVTLLFCTYFVAAYVVPKLSTKQVIHTLFNTSQVMRATTTALDKDQLRQGITGVQIGLEGADIHPKIHSVDEGGAAYDAGIKRGTYIIKLDGHGTAAMSEQEWVKNLRGVASTPLTLTLSDKDTGGTEYDITVTRRPISALKTNFARLAMVENDGGSMSSYASHVPAFINKYEGAQILEFYDDKTGPSKMAPQLINLKSCPLWSINGKEPLVRRFNIKDPESRAIAVSLGIHKAPAYYFAPHGAWCAEPNQVELEPLKHTDYRPVCDHKAEAKPGRWPNIK